MVNVVIMNMEHGMHEMIVSNHDGSHTVFLNARDSNERRMQSYYHAMRHLEQGDFEKYSVQQIESEAHMQRKGEDK